MEESNQIQELNQTMQEGFKSVTIAIDNLAYPIENNNQGNGSENGILLIILIFVLISINKNLKKLVQLNSSKKE